MESIQYSKWDRDPSSDLDRRESGSGQAHQTQPQSGHTNPTSSPTDRDSFSHFLPNRDAYVGDHRSNRNAFTNPN